MNELSIEELKIILGALLFYKNSFNINEKLFDKIFDLQEKIIDEWENRENDNKRIQK